MPRCSFCRRQIDASRLTPLQGFVLCPQCLPDQCVHCSICNESVFRDNAYRHGESYYCEACYDNHFVTCRYCYEIVRRDTAHVLSGHGFACPRCYRNEYAACYRCGTMVERHDMHHPPESDNRYCRSCFNEDYTYCHNCGISINLDDARFNGDRAYCRDCYGRSIREWESQPFAYDAPTFQAIGSRRKFGVELETSSCHNHFELFGHTIWECKPDCSIQGLEFVSPVLYGDQGLEEIDRFTQEAQRRNWRTNRYCGYHAHFDLTEENWESLRNIAYAYRKTYELWDSFVSDARSNNSMCGAPDYDLGDIERINNAEDWDYFVGARDRFEFLNWRAYLVHGTVEIRSHDPTLNSIEICNWIKVHTRFIDFVKEWNLTDLDTFFSGNKVRKFEAFASIVGPALADYYAERAHSYGKPVRVAPRVGADRLVDFASRSNMELAS